MFCKLAFSNVRKSFKDYTIYFLTLMFGVCIFYTFNSIDSQQAMLNISQSQQKILESLTDIISGLSAFISIILGFLILYANNFLIRRRKKELGIYLLLGCPKGRVSRILILETLIIGILALAAGLGLGLAASQGLSIVSAKLFEVELAEFHFIFSSAAFWKSILYFGVIFFVVIVFNTITISKYKLIDLLYAHRKNQTFRVRRTWVSVLLFLLSAACLAAAYTIFLRSGLANIMSPQFLLCILLGIIGTFLFFRSLSGFFLRLVQASPRLYYKGLNMFILRQMSSKINTTHVSMTIICLMLLVTIGTLSSGMGLSNALTANLNEVTPYDASFWTYIKKGENPPADYSPLRLVQEDVPALSSLLKETCEIRERYCDVTFEQLMLPGTDNNNSLISVDYVKKQNVSAMSLSDFNRARAMQGREPISLSDGQFAVNCTYDSTLRLMEDFLSQEGSTIDLGGVTLTSAYRSAFTDYTFDTSSPMTVGTLILPDRLANALPVTAIYTNMNYVRSGEEGEAAFIEAMEAVYLDGDPAEPYTMALTRQTIYEQSFSLRVMITYVIIYIGLVFLITSAAVLALQQLSESSDNAERYALLRKLGAEKKMINRALFTQIFLYFMAPLLLAVVHSAVALKVAIDVVTQFGKVDIMATTIFTAIIMLLVYGGYFFATYFGSKNMIASKKK